MAKVVMYTTAVCPFCINAKRLLEDKGVDFDEIRVDREPQLREHMRAESGQHTVPQIWVGSTHVGGFTDLWALEKSGKLDELLT